MLRCGMALIAFRPPGCSSGNLVAALQEMPMAWRGRIYRLASNRIMGLISILLRRCDDPVSAHGHRGTQSDISGPRRKAIALDVVC